MASFEGFLLKLISEILKFVMATSLAGHLWQREVRWRCCISMSWPVNLLSGCWLPNLARCLFSQFFSCRWTTDFYSFISIHLPFDNRIAQPPHTKQYPTNLDSFTMNFTVWSLHTKLQLALSSSLHLANNRLDTDAFVWRMIITDDQQDSSPLNWFWNDDSSSTRRCVSIRYYLT